MPDNCSNCDDYCDECCSDCCRDNNGENGNLNRKIYKDKKPLSRERHIGIEIEFTSDFSGNEIADVLETEGLDEICCLKYDASINARNRAHGHELTILTKEKSFRQDLRKICKLLNGKFKADINASCGLHVHFDMRSRDHLRVYHNLVSTQDLLYKMNPPSRKTNTYCKPSPINFTDTVHSQDRYLAINPCAFRKFKTIEVRLHAGSTNATKIINWIELLLTLVNKRKRLTSVKSTLTMLAKETKIRNKIKQYIAERIQTFEAPVQSTGTNN